jgi:hypothetical protein
MVFQYRFTTRPSKVSRKLYSIVPILQPCQKMLAKRIFVFFVNLQQSWPPRTSKDIVECDCGWNCKSVESQVSRKWLRLSTQTNFEPMAAFLAIFYSFCMRLLLLRFTLVFKRYSVVRRFGERHFFRSKFSFQFIEL